MLGFLWVSSLMTVTMQGDALLATMHVAHLSGGTLAVPPGLNSAVIEIGCSDRDTMDDEELDKHFPNSFLLSFEPLVDKYALLLAKGTKRFVGSKKDVAVPLGRHHQRGVVLPFAVSPAGGDINFTVSAVAGCSSIAKIHPQSKFKNTLRGWGLKCDEAFEKRIVPSITLEQVLPRPNPSPGPNPTVPSVTLEQVLPRPNSSPDPNPNVPSIMLEQALRLTGELPVLRLKIDAQGVDLQLVRSVPPAYFSRRVETVELEFAGDNCMKTRTLTLTLTLTLTRTRTPTPTPTLNRRQLQGCPAVRWPGERERGGWLHGFARLHQGTFGRRLRGDRDCLPQSAEVHRGRGGAACRPTCGAAVA